ncbi:MAG TPA: ATP-binding cassette domain-containing protein [Oligoflexia bacterium]|nr:ATP-binding cassette domain-containing protein [Oligoflexia bacterium]HMP47829.1 ATP-binding cassette domain-containing protein [Oligoflexia bacterium]
MDFVIQADHVVKTYIKPKRSLGILGSIRDLFKRDYELVRAVDDITLNIRQGEFIGYIGPNGAGKSTSIKILTGILQASSGTVRVLGLDPFKDRRAYTRQIGVVFGQRTQLWWDIAVQESFSLLKRIYQIKDSDYRSRLDELVTLFQVGSLLQTPVRKLSLGERMKCDIIASLLHKPAILFLDEPTIGLDAIAKESIREVLLKLHTKGDTTILLTTHDLQEIEELCDRIIVLDHGKIVYDGDLFQIKNLSGLSHRLSIEFVETPDITIRDTWIAIPGVIEISGEGRHLFFDFDHREISVPLLLQQIFSYCEVRDLQVSEPSIEDVIKKLYRSGFNTESYLPDSRQGLV